MVMANWTKPRAGTHVYAVLRHDSYIADPVQAIVGTTGWTNLEQARDEADRMNGLNGDKKATYFVVVVRIREGPFTDPTDV
jgi:hypothetical protein